LRIPLEHIEPALFLEILPTREQYTCEFADDAQENGESPYQIAEGQFYQYRFANEKFGFNSSEVVEPFVNRNDLGRISPNIFVGTLPIDIVSNDSKEIVGEIQLEVRSTKTDYRSDYRFMLEEITEHCTELLMQLNAPVQQTYEVDFGRDSITDYQRFAFVNSIMNSDIFHGAMQKILSSPSTKWSSDTEFVDIRNTRRFDQKSIRQIVSGSNRSTIPEDHPLMAQGISTIPAKIENTIKTDSVDTAENRFVKHALEVFLRFCMDFHSSVKNDSRESKEAKSLINTLEEYLNHNLFKSVSRPTTLKLNSPVLQRKEGYREVLKIWMIFDLAAKLIWEGGEDIYHAGKRDIATLYEYWLFFKLLDLISGIFKIEAKELDQLIKPTLDGLGLQLKQGKHTALKGIYDSSTRKLNIKFSYNRVFKGYSDYPDGGSWTKTLRPDYTLTIWPFGPSEVVAEDQELITHVHFDAKYKIDRWIEYEKDRKSRIRNLDKDALENEEQNEQTNEKTEQAKGRYKNADLLKMHAYRDAIRRTGGAYVLYPGDLAFAEHGFHEILPGLGAFPLKPSQTDSGINELKGFILKVVDHFINRASQRERITLKQFQIYKDKPKGEVNEKLPEPYGQNRAMVPGEVGVIVGYYHKTKNQLDWIVKNHLYNTRINSVKGSLRIDSQLAGAKYLLLHTDDDKCSDLLFELDSEGPRIFTKDEMIKKGYPNPSQDAYLVFRIFEIHMADFDNAKWNFRKLSGFNSGRGSWLPFAVNLSELMSVKVK